MSWGGRACASLNRTLPLNCARVLLSQGVKPKALERVTSAPLRALIEQCIAHDPQDRPDARHLLKCPWFDSTRMVRQCSRGGGGGGGGGSTARRRAAGGSRAPAGNPAPSAPCHCRPDRRAAQEVSLAGAGSTFLGLSSSGQLSHLSSGALPHSLSTALGTHTSHTGHLLSITGHGGLLPPAATSSSGHPAGSSTHTTGLGLGAPPGLSSTATAGQATHTATPANSQSIPSRMPSHLFARASSAHSGTAGSSPFMRTSAASRQGSTSSRAPPGGAEVGSAPRAASLARAPHAQAMEAEHAGPPPQQQQEEDKDEDDDGVGSVIEHAMDEELLGEQEEEQEEEGVEAGQFGGAMEADVVHESPSLAPRGAGGHLPHLAMAVVPEETHSMMHLHEEEEEEEGEGTPSSASSTTLMQGLGEQQSAALPLPMHLHVRTAPRQQASDGSPGQAAPARGEEAGERSSRTSTPSARSARTLSGAQRALSSHHSLPGSAAQSPLAGGRPAPQQQHRRAGSRTALGPDGGAAGSNGHAGGAFALGGGEGGGTAWMEVQEAPVGGGAYRQQGGGGGGSPTVAIHHELRAIARRMNPSEWTRLVCRPQGSLCCWWPRRTSHCAPWAPPPSILGAPQAVPRRATTSTCPPP